MKKLACLIILSIAVTACQKSINNVVDRSGRRDIDGASSARDSGIASVDSAVVSGDTLTYEVITTDREGWYGVWNDSTGNLVSSTLDHITYGTPEHLMSGWKYTFVCPSIPFQALISVASRDYAHDITVRLYRNGKLLASSTNDEMKGVAKLLVSSKTVAPSGTSADPELTYEILISDQDTTKFESDGWVGTWNKANGKGNGFIDSLPVDFPYNPFLLEFAIPSGWKYSFKPDKFPFTMRVDAAPYTKDGAKITTNFYVNGQLVKSSASRESFYLTTYVVQ